MMSNKNIMRMGILFRNNKYRILRIQIKINIKNFRQKNK
jgi:hypothetical protein